MATCDAHYRFVYMVVGHYGGESDGGVSLRTWLMRILGERRFGIPQQENTISKRAEAQDNAKTADIYHEAFEVQLAKNRALTRSLVELQLRRGIQLARRPYPADARRLIDDLLENLCDKNEALVHQQVMVKLLALQL
ncbi:hypothetical protein V5799_025266 [Amblyomma americanum]|uniref:Uncharacterized protein n=1 Tax=Amblyomma americanum TaxID=6943 RepID=A0AAQ4EA25_AMBAM